MKEKLLVLDDEPHILTSLEDLFEDDYEVFTTGDADAALRLAKEQDMAVVLSDERMPGLGGHEFLRRVKEVSAATRVMISGYSDMSALTDAVNGGQIFAYVGKPWEPLELKATIAAAVVHFKLVREIGRERELLRALMENSPDLIYFKDRDSRFTRVNQEQARTLGASDPTACVGKSDADYFESECASRWYEDEQEIVRSGQPQADRIEKLIKPNRDVCWMSTTKVPMFDKSGRVSGIAGISRDITNLKSVEESLREQSEHNRLIIETANDAFIGMDADGAITAWNRQAQITFGWTAAEVMGRRLCDTIIPPACHEAHAHGVEHFLTNARGSLLNKAIELDALHRDGHEFRVEATVWPVRVGGVCSFNSFVRDITERRCAEEARKKETTLVKLLQAVTLGANESSTIENAAQICLDRICSHTGWPVGHGYLLAPDSAGELISAGLWHVEQGARFIAFQEASEGCHFGGETGLPRSVLTSGKPEWIVNLADDEHFSRRGPAGRAGLRSGFSFPIVVEKKIMGILEFFSLQTAQPDEELLTLTAHLGSQLGQVMVRQRAEEDLQRAKASAESANRAKSEFLATMSHELRTPMNAILGIADLLAESPLNSEHQGYVRIFQRAGAKLLNLINDILDLSKVESGRYELESIDFDLGALLEKTVELLLPRARDCGLGLLCEVLPGIPRELAGDPDRLRQILINLIGNALKFTAQGSVTLRVEPDPGGAAGWLRFSVIDTGIGIAAEKMEMIFANFTQADSSTTRKYGGTGLGLAISKGLVELMGGHIGCTSEVGRGSTFFFAVPFAPCGQRDHTADETDVTPPEFVDKLVVSIPAGPAGPERTIRILVAEDCEDNLFLIQAYLKDSGLELDIAENGEIAVKKVVSGNYDLVLMDVQMPVMDGHEATRAIRQWEAKTKARPLPILALTAHAMKEEAHKSSAAGCTSHLTKPVTKTVLLEAISLHTGWKLHGPPSVGIGGLVPKYLQHVRRDMKDILTGIELKDFQVARKLAHQLKGSGRGYGFPEITTAGAAIERAAKDANEAEIRSQLRALSEHLDGVAIKV